MLEKDRPLSAREDFIVAKGNDFSPVEIEVLLKRNGFEPVSHTRIYQILEAHKIAPVGVRQRNQRRTK